ncbi:MAG: hypothetical protein KF847_05000 [Pirellulales bacterium]|nr:hypothetical protein [Pirellulales bacterium]
MRRLAVAMACLLAGGGCRICSDSCDTSPPVAGSSYSNPYGRSGSAFSGGPVIGTISAPPVEASDDASPAAAYAPVGATPQITASAMGWTE